MNKEEQHDAAWDLVNMMNEWGQRWINPDATNDETRVVVSVATRMFLAERAHRLMNMKLEEV